MYAAQRRCAPEINGMPAEPPLKSIAGIATSSTRVFALTRRVRGAKNRETCPLVVSLLPRCGAHHASEAASLPGRAGCKPPRVFGPYHPTTPGGENLGFHLLLILYR
jgi:hypothetical protein